MNGIEVSRVIFFFCMYIFSLFQLHLRSRMLCFIFFYSFWRITWDNIWSSLLDLLPLLCFPEKKHDEHEARESREWKATQGIKREKRTKMNVHQGPERKKHRPGGIDLPLWGVHQNLCSVFQVSCALYFPVSPMLFSFSHSYKLSHLLTSQQKSSLVLAEHLRGVKSLCIAGISWHDIVIFLSCLGVCEDLFHSLLKADQ